MVDEPDANSQALRRRRRSKIVLCLVVLLTCGPVVVDWTVSGVSTPIRYFAADTFYYLTVARNFARTGSATFDQAHPTNGFHPLWQLAATAIYWVTDRFQMSDTAYMGAILLACLLLVAAGIALLCIAFWRAKGRLPDYFLLLPVGAYGLLVAPWWAYFVGREGANAPASSEGPLILYGTSWSAMNGMETPLVLLLFGLAAICLPAWRIETATWKSTAAVAALVALFVLARLDHVFIAAAWLGWLGWQAIRSDQKMRSSCYAAACAAGVAAIILGYLAINIAYAESALPMSGQAKSTFPVFCRDNVNFVTQWLSNPLARTQLPVFFRIAQLILPALAAVAWYVVLWRGRRNSAGTVSAVDRFDGFIAATGLGVVLLAGYGFCFVPFLSVGHWYYPISTLYVSLVVACAVWRWFQEREANAYWPGVAYAAAVVLIFCGLHRQPEYHRAYATFYFEEAPRILAHYRGENPKFVEYDDGIVAFATGAPTMNGFGLVLDSEAYRAYKQRQVLDLAVRRGYDRLCTLVYPEMRINREAEAAIARLGPGWKLDVEYESPISEFKIYHLFNAGAG